MMATAKASRANAQKIPSKDVSTDRDGLVNVCWLCVGLKSLSPMTSFSITFSSSYNTLASTSLSSTWVFTMLIRINDKSPLPRYSSSIPRAAL